jgi:hypothetical protein
LRDLAWKKAAVQNNYRILKHAEGGKPFSALIIMPEAGYDDAERKRPRNGSPEDRGK